MNVAASLVPTFFLPTGAFTDLPELSNDLDYHSSKIGDQIDGTATSVLDPNVSLEDWNFSLLNPRNRIEALGSISPSRWRIDGSSSQGLRFFATPVFLQPDLVPRRIDVFVLDQAKIPPHLEPALQACTAFSLMDGRVSQLGISQLLVEALDYQTVSQSDFVDTYNKLPFGSRIVVENIAACARDIKMHLVPDLESERKMLSIEALQEMWMLDEDCWPKAVQLQDLRLKRQLHDTVALVGIAEPRGRDDTFIFKSAVEDVKYAYHELKMLLTIPAHPHVMPRPTYCVTLPDRYGGPSKLCGFILPYFPHGSLSEVLCSQKMSDSLRLRDQIRWAKQITSTLIFVATTPARFYSELKTDNILLSSKPTHLCSTPSAVDSIAQKGREEESNVILIDWEQMGNWLEMSAPEIHYLEFAMYLAKPTTEGVPDSTRSVCRELVRKHMPDFFEAEHIYTNPTQGYYQPWIALKPWQHEAAMVFSLGMILWCIFEGVPSPKNPLSKTFKQDDLQEFPQFSHRTPPRIRSLIQDCTRGSRSWAVPEFDIVRRGTKFYPRGKSGVNGEPVGTEYQTRLAAREMWKQRLSEMEAFLTVKERYEDGGSLRRKDDEAFLGYPLRPRLVDVLAVLKGVGA
jgi:hypothetical protein